MQQEPDLRFEDMDQTEPEQELAPEQERFSDLLSQVRDLALDKAAEHGTETDPMRNLRAAEDWGVEPWVACMVKVSQQVTRLQKLQSLGVTSEYSEWPKSIERSFLEIATGAINALVLYEEAKFEQQIAVVPAGTLSDLGRTLTKLREWLDQFQQQTQAQVDDEVDHAEVDHDEHVHVGFDDAVAAQTDEEADGDDEPEPRAPIYVSEEVAEAMNRAATGYALDHAKEIELDVDHDWTQRPSPDVIRGEPAGPDVIVKSQEMLFEAEAALRREGEALLKVAGRHHNGDDTADLHEHGRHVARILDGERDSDNEEEP